MGYYITGIQLGKKKINYYFSDVTTAFNRLSKRCIYIRSQCYENCTISEIAINIPMALFSLYSPLKKSCISLSPTFPASVMA